MRLGLDIDMSSDMVGVKDPVQYFLKKAPSKPDLNQTCGHRALVFLLESASIDFRDRAWSGRVFHYVNQTWIRRIDL